MTEPTTPGKAAPKTAKARMRMQAGEYGQWVAADEVRTPSGGLAYAPGHPVPVSNVDDEGRIVLGRHQCDGDPGCGGTPTDRCERFNEPTEWSEPGAARPVG